MLSNTIYLKYQPLHTLLEQHPQVKDQLAQIYFEHRTGNPSVVNKHFRNLLESFGFNYHKQGYSPKEIAYRIQYNDWSYHYCRTCGKEVDKFDSFENGFQHHCNAKCSGLDPNTLAVRKQTCLEKYGVDNSSKSTQAREKTKETWLEKYGVECYQQTKEFSDKWKSTYANKTEDELAVWQQRREETTKKNYGVSNPRQSKEIQDQIKQNCLAKYGVEHPQQVLAIREKTSNTFIERYGVLAHSNSNKVYTFPSGNQYVIQGHEDRAIAKLLAEGYSEQDLQLSTRKSIRYFWSSNDGFGDDRWHLYHPDIVIPKETRIIEVKSSYTYDGKGKNPKTLSQNLAKEKACVAAGYKFCLLYTSDAADE